LTETAQLLGVSTSQLNQDVQSGTTLSSLASQTGVSSTSLVSAIESDLQANAPQGAQPLSSTQLTQIANNIANGTAPSGGGQFSAGGSAGGVTGAGPQSNLASLASTLGSDPTTLLAQLISGQDLSSALSGPSATVSGTSLANSILGGVAVEEYA
jgi:flagellar capping protein FliD